ncbi:MAG: glycosyltransferase family 2 protein [Candidatus Omnitrophota bacterium]
MNRNKITAVIIAKNEEKRIIPCLESIKWCDEMVVIDDMSTDDTHSICRRFKARLIAHPLNEDYAAQRNIGIENSNSEWILQLDADERVSSGLKNDIKSILSKGSGFSAYRITRRNYFLGKFMKYGGWQEKQTKLFRKKSAKYVGRIHEQLKIDGKVGELSSYLEHYPFDSIEGFINRQLYYANIESDILHKERGRIELKEIKYHIMVKPIKLFIKLFIRKQGFRDGMHGFIFSILNAWRHLAIWAIYFSKYYKEG